MQHEPKLTSQIQPEALTNRNGDWSNTAKCDDGRFRLNQQEHKSGAVPTTKDIEDMWPIDMGVQKSWWPSRMIGDVKLMSSVAVASS